MFRQRIKKLVEAGFSELVAFSIELDSPNIKSILFEELQWMWTEVNWATDASETSKILELMKEKAETFDHLKWVLEILTLSDYEKGQIIALMMEKAKTVGELQSLWGKLCNKSDERTKVFERMKEKAKEIK